MPRYLLASLAVQILALGATANAVAQHRPPPDTLPSAARASAVLQVTDPLVLAIVPDSASQPQDSALSAARDAAARFGFRFLIRQLAPSRLVDPDHAAVYFVPADFTRGFLIAAPGLRPDMLRGRVTADSLSKRVANYRISLRSLRP
jgi:hypothetical protein